MEKEKLVNALAGFIDISTEREFVEVAQMSRMAKQEIVLSLLGTELLRVAWHVELTGKQISDALCERYTEAQLSDFLSLAVDFYAFKGQKSFDIYLAKERLLTELDKVAKQ